MSTRAIYTFKDESGSFNVYKHHDGYPSGAVESILAATKNAWELPRFEADEFAAAFIAANKTSAGGVRLLQSGKPLKVAPGDIAYRYEIAQTKDGLRVAAFETDCDWRTNKWSEGKLFECEFSKLASALEAYEAENA